MSKTTNKRNDSILGPIILLFLFIKYCGLNFVLNLFYQLLKFFNQISTQLFNTSILNLMFKHWLVYSIVGFILSFVGTSGKEGRFLGKILYFIIGYIVTFIFDIIISIIF